MGDHTTEDRVALGGGDGGAREVRGRWEWMMPELLALILVRIPPDEMLRSVPFVCRSWREAVMGPHCWAEIDVQQWSRQVNRSESVVSAVRDLVRRSNGSLRCLSTYRLGNSCFSFVASSVRFLRVLRIPMSDVTDETVEANVASLATLTELDISYCLNISSRGIASFGQHCKSLVHLERTIPPSEVQFNYLADEEAMVVVDEEEAMVVASTMPGLQHLQLNYGKFSNLGLDAILTGCGALRYLDICGCNNVELEGDIKERCWRIRQFKSQFVGEYTDYTSSDVWTSDDDYVINTDRIGVEEEEEGQLLDPDTSPSSSEEVDDVDTSSSSSEEFDDMDTSSNDSEDRFMH